MPIQPTGEVRFNKEYFGYLAGFPTGEIRLLSHDAEEALHRNASYEDARVYEITDFSVNEGFYLQTPVLVWLELTLACNLTCPHCYISAGKRREKEMSLERLHGLLDEIADAGVWGIAFTGGEPTMHPGFADLVNHSRERNLLVGIATNGMFLTEDLLHKLPRQGVIISISLDDLHIGGRNPDADFQIASRSILRCREMGFALNIMTNTNRRNIDKLVRLMDWAALNGVSVRSVPFSPLGRGRLHPELANVPADVQKATEFWIREVEFEHRYHADYGLCIGSIFNYGLTMSYMTRRCASGRYLCYICSDGQVYPCTMCAGEGIFESGSVTDRPFLDVWRDRWEIRRYSWENFAKTCEGCVINRPEYYCAARCPAMSHARNKHYFGCGASDFEILSTIIRTATLAGSSVHDDSVESIELADLGLKRGS